MDAFEHADRAIRLLRRQRIPVGVNCVVSRANFDYPDELARCLRWVRVRDVLYLRLKLAGRAAADYQRTRMAPEQAGAFFHVDCAMMPFLFCHQPDMYKLRFTCGEGYNGVNEIVEISPDGQVHACSFAAGSVGDAHFLP